MVNDTESIRLLLRSDAKINQPGSHGETAIHIAVMARNYDATKYLLANGADPNIIIQDNNLSLPLYIAASNEFWEIVSLLLHYNALHDDLDFSTLENRDEVMAMINGRYREDEWSIEKMDEHYMRGVIPDVLDFEYPPCPPVDIERRYTNQEYIKDLKEKMKHNRHGGSG